MKLRRVVSILSMNFVLGVVTFLCVPVFGVMPVMMQPFTLGAPAVTVGQQAYLKAANVDSGDDYGVSLAIDGDTIAVGAIYESSNQTTITNGTTASADNSKFGSGAVYVYKRTGNTWAQEAYLKAANADANDNFGYSVAISGDTIVVGSIGEASNQTTITNGATGSADNSKISPGAAYVFRRTGTTWAEEAYLKAPNCDTWDSFGYSVAISGETIVVGAYGESSNQSTITNGTTASADNSLTNAGAAYVFRRSGVNWAQEAYLKPPNPDSNDYFGYSVAISGETIVVSSQQESSNQTTITNGTTASSNNSASNAGAAYVFRRAGTTWAQEAYLKAANADAGDRFGQSVSISGDTIVIGAQSEASNQTTVTNGPTASADNSRPGAGAAYVFKRVGTIWSEEAYLKAPNPDAGDTFGYSVGISGDTIVVGSRYESSNQKTITNGTAASMDNSSASSGAAYVFKRTGSNWVQAAYIKAPNADAGDFFGYGVAISGDTLAVTAYAEGSNQNTITNGATASANNSKASSGAAYVFQISAPWQEEAYLKAPNVDANDNFGSSVAISTDTLIVGAYGESSNQTTITNGTSASADNSVNSAGAAYVFRRVGTAWAQEAFLKAPNPDAGDYFGQSVSISGDTAVVGACYEDSNQTTITNGTSASADNSLIDSGAVYVFKRTGTTWAQEAYIKAPNPAGNNKFGWSVSVDGDTIAVGAIGESSNQTTITNGTTASSDTSSTSSGAVYVFKRTGSNWAQEAYIKAPNADSYDNFGRSVAISNDTIIAGAYAEGSNQTTITNGTTASADNSKAQAGAAYIFRRTGGIWAQEAYLKPPNPDAGDYFGFSVAIDRETAVVGAWLESSNQATITNGTTASANNSKVSAGAAYVFKRTGTTWAQEAYLKPTNTDANDNFGNSVAIYGDTVVVAALNESSKLTSIINGPTASSDNSLSSAGAVYVFTRAGSIWSQAAYLKAPVLHSVDQYGSWVAISNDTIVVGASREASNQNTITNGPGASSNTSKSLAGAAYVIEK